MSSADADSYIGSFISLITNSDIRYQGFLFQLNTKYTTIALRNVKSFGTEGRRKDGSQVPPSEGIYEYIYFKGTDIKELQVKSSPPRQSTFNVLDDPAIIQSHLSLPTSPVSLSTSGALEMENISHDAQSALHPPFSQGNHSLHSSIAWSPSSSIPSSPLNNKTPASPSYWPGFHHLPSLSQGLIVSHPSQQQPNSSLMNMLLATNSPNVLESHHSFIPPKSPGSQNGLHAPQKSPVFSSSGIPSLTLPLATGSQNGFPPISPGVQNVLFPVPQMSTMGSPNGLPFVPPSSDTSPLNGFPPMLPLSATYSSIPHKIHCSQDSIRPVGPLSTFGSLDGLPSLPSSSVTGSRDLFQPLHPFSTRYPLIPPLSPGSQSSLPPLHLLSVTGSSDALHSLPPSSAAVNGFSLATPSPAVHYDAGLFSMPAFNISPSLPSNINFTGLSTPSDLKNNLTSSTSAHVNTVTTSVKEVATSIPGPVAPCSSMLISVKPTADTRDFVDNNPIKPSDSHLQQEQKQLPSSHYLRIINAYDPVQVSASVALSSGPENVKEPPQQIEKPRANRLEGATSSSQYHNTYHAQRPRDEKDRDMLQLRHIDRSYGKGRAKLPNGYRTHAKAHEKVRDVLQNGRSDRRGYKKGRENLPNGAVLHAQYDYRSHAKARRHEVKKDKDALQGGRNDWGYAKGRENLPNGAVLHTQHGCRVKARGYEVNGSNLQASHSNKKLGGDHRSNGFLLSTRRLGRAYPSGGTRDLRPVEKFTEDFNFEAMNEKFNKEELWGLLGESTVTKSEHKNEAIEYGPVKVDNKPVYCKDDFFDTLSSNTHDQQSGRGRVKLSERRRIDSETFGEIQKLSERKRIDSETFGEIQKHQRGRGIQGPRRAGGSQGSYRGRGYDHPGRGRGRTVWSRVT